MQASVYVRLMTTEGWEDLWSFGPQPIASDVRTHLGEFQLVPFDASALFYRRPPSSGDHGGLSPGEIRIRLFLA